MWCVPHILKRSRSWNHLEQAGTTRNELELSGRRYNQLYQDGTSTKLTQKIRNSLEGNFGRNTIFQKDIKLAIVIVESNTISDVHR